MAYNQAFNAYKKTGVQTASRGKLVVMLYDEAVKQLTFALSNFVNNKVPPKNIEKLNANILKSQEIITELMVSLDMTNGGSEIAKNLLSLYTYFNSELLDANINHNKDKISFVLSMMDELRGAWIQAEKTTSTPVADMQHSINISG
ncbi:MAG: flagellar export chaperone FliS [Treponema sp.]|nr:flagellar export chaperone FliS [Treponema sp.]